MIKHRSLEAQGSVEKKFEAMQGITKYYISTWVKNTNSFRNLLNTSKGRDKCA